MSCDFKTTTHAKCIIAGEHSVLRGHSALVFPITSKNLHLEYTNNSEAATAEFKGTAGEDTHLLFWSVIEQGLEIVERTLNQLTGKFIINSNIPIGAGMGASAALCAAIGQWFAWKNWISQTEIYEFAIKLEGLFHSESSGVDIVGALASCGMVFSRSGQPERISPNWQPKWYLSSSQQIGVTAHCVKKVKELFVKQKELATNIDLQMAASVEIAIKALSSTAEQGISLLQNAISKATDCFQQWGLLSDNVMHHIKNLQDLGALAAKPTGSGDGGFVLSLWKSQPPTESDIEFIPLT